MSDMWILDRAKAQPPTPTQKGPEMTWRDWFDQVLEPAGYSADVLTIGCEECPGIDQWPDERSRAFAYLMWPYYGLAQLTGYWPRFSSLFRCPPCNTRRDGAEQSGHLADMGGLPYCAMDINWDHPSRLRNQVIPYLPAVPDAVRQWLGFDVGVGVIAYKGDTRLHVDLRPRDYVKDHTK